MRETGKKTKPTARGSFLTPRMLAMKESGLRTTNMATGRRHGTTEVPAIRDSSIRAKRMAQAGLTGKMEASTRVSL